MIGQQVDIGEWTVHSIVDDDGHLSVYITHSDSTPIYTVDEDISVSDIEWAARFTTEGIEDIYRED